MTAFASLWLPILISAIAVFFASSVMNSVLPWHKNDFAKVPDEGLVRSALRPLALAPGEYMVPRTLDRKEMMSPEFIAKMNEGPVLTMTVFPNGPISMLKSLVLWFVFNVVIAAVAACVAGSVVPPGGETHDVFHFTALITFLCYGVALWQSSIWYGRPWTTTIKSTVDGLIYALITGGVFVWLWPNA